MARLAGPGSRKGVEKLAARTFEIRFSFLGEYPGRFLCS